MNDANWIEAANSADLSEDTVCRFDYGSKTFAIYNSEGEYFATDGFCTHEQQHLEDGLVMDGIIECPLHMGQFDIETGEALSGPVCLDLKTYEVKNENGKIFIKL